jgi:hypothetical protein
MPVLRSHVLRIAAELPKGNTTRRELLAALQRHAKSIGPYIWFNGRLWVFASGLKENPRKDTWTRVRLANRTTGAPLKKEMQVTWGKAGELSAYENHSRQMTYKYEDGGFFAPPVKPKEVRDALKGSSLTQAIAQEILDRTEAEGVPADAALGFAADLMTDVNWGGVLGGDNQIRTLAVNDVSGRIGYALEDAASIAWHIASKLRNSGAKSLLEAAMGSELKETRMQELREELRRI